MHYRLYCLLGFSALAFGQNLVVTAEGHHGATLPDLTKDELSVEVDHKPAALRDWIPLRGDQDRLELYLLIDDGTDTDVGSQFGSLKAFINGQPATTRIGLAYLRNGAAEILAPLSDDHEHIAKALRIPMGQPGIAASPYMGVSDLVKKWPAADARREVLMITSGVDPWSPPDPQNPYLMQAIRDAQRAGVLVNSIYFGGAGHSGNSYRQTNWGQNYLSELSDETGGEHYWQGFGNPVSFDPYLKDLTERLQHQYLLTIDAAYGNDDLEPVKVTTTAHGVSLIAASKIHLRK